MRNFTSMKNLAFIIITFSFLIFSLTTSSAQQSPLNIQFSPNPAELKTNEERIVKLTLSSEQQISAFDLKFQTSGGLSILDFDNRMSFDSKIDPFSLKQVSKNITRTNSSLTYIINASSNLLPKRIDLYLKILGTTTGEGKITIDFNNSQILGGRGNLLQINPNQSATFNLNLNQSSPDFIDPTTLPALAYPEDTAKINLKLKLHGAQASPQNPLKATAVAVGRVGDSKYETQVQGFELSPSGNETLQGSFAFPNFKDGTKFSLMIKVDKYFLKRICDIAGSEQKPGSYICTDPKLTIRQGENSFDFSAVALMPGDLGLTDGLLNSYDLSIVRNNLNKNTPEAVNSADLNYDGKVDQKDFELISFVAANTERESDQ